MTGLTECQSAQQEAGIKLLAKRQSNVGGKMGERTINICLVESNPALKCCWTARYHRRLTGCDEGGKMKKQEVGKSKKETENHQKLIVKKRKKKCKGKPRIFHHVHLERETTMHQSIPPADGAIEIL